MELFRSKTAFRRLLIACALQASIQMTGVSAIQYYSVTIYGQIGISGDNTLKYQGINSIIALIGQFCTILFIDKTGRRWPLILGNLGNMVTFIIATILLAKFPPGVSTNIGAQWGFIIMTWLCEYPYLGVIERWLTGRQTISHSHAPVDHCRGSYRRRYLIPELDRKVSHWLP